MSEEISVSLEVNGVGLTEREIIRGYALLEKEAEKRGVKLGSIYFGPKLDTGQKLIGYEFTGKVLAAD